MRALFSLFAVVVMSAVAVAAGCGDDESDTGGYREEASALCRDMFREVERLPPPRSARGLERYLRDTLRFSRDWSQRYEALEPPSELAALHERSLRLNERAERLTEEVVDKLEAGGTPRELMPEYFGKLLEIGKRDNELARQLGLPDCVTPLPGPGGDAPAPA